MGFADEMQEFDEETAAAAEANAAKRGGPLLPDGKHQAQIHEFRIDRGEDEWVIMAKFVNSEGSARKWYNLGNEVGRSIALEDAQMLGYESDRLSQIETWIESEAPIGLICDIAVKTKPGKERDFTNVYVNRVLGKAELQNFVPSSDVSDDAFPAAADDDIPF
jgi:hypothetical protein